MKKLSICILMIVGLAACNANSIENFKKSVPDNYVVILDLSDRIIQRIDQIDIDTSAIRGALEKFEIAVQRNLTVKSKDKFSIRIINQKNSSLPSNIYENSLSIDMAKYNAGEKAIRLNSFKSDFSTNVKTLYQQALLGNKNTDYEGVDIWQYFNEQINNDLCSEYNNHVLILTDGYFDFEDNSHGINIQNNATISTPLLSKMNTFDWKKQAEDNNIGLIPVSLKIEAAWVICGIQPKSTAIDLLEAEKLGYLWKKWLTQSGAKNVNEPIMNSSSLKIKGLITKTL